MANFSLDQVHQELYDGVRDIGFSRARKSEPGENPERCIMYSINDIHNNCSLEWSTFPLMFSVKGNYIYFKIIFSIDSLGVRIIDTEKLDNIKKYIFLVNRQLKIGYFHYDPAYKYIQYKINQMILTPVQENRKIPVMFTDEGVSAYTAFGYGLYELYKKADNSPDKISKLINEGITRYNISESKSLLFNRAKLVKNLSENTINEEKNLISKLQNHELLHSAFIMNKYAFSKGGTELKVPLIRYGEEIIDDKAIPYRFQLLRDVINTNPILCKQLKEVIYALLDLNLAIMPINETLEHFVCYKKKIFFAYKKQLSIVLSTITNDAKSETELDILYYLSEVIERIKQQSVFKIQDINGRK